MSKRAVIVGNSDGIGLALTRRLLHEGWSVVGLSRSASPEIRERYVHHVIDVSTPEYPAVLTKALGDGTADGVDLCVYAAGIGDTLDLDHLGAQTRTIEVNLLGAARTVEVVVPRMVAAGSGHLVALSSLADVLVSGDAPAYAASKAGLSTYFRGLAAALRPHGVRVTTVRFGFVDTKMAKSPVRPMLLTTNRAVDVVMRCLRRRPVAVSRPRRMALLVSAMRTLQRLPGR